MMATEHVRSDRRQHRTCFVVNDPTGMPNFTCSLAFQTCGWLPGLFGSGGAGNGTTSILSAPDASCGSRRRGSGGAFNRLRALTFLSITSAFLLNSSSGRVVMREARAQQRERNSKLMRRSASNAVRYLSIL